jgi:hypothetical protein
LLHFAGERNNVYLMLCGAEVEDDKLQQQENGVP